MEHSRAMDLLEAYALGVLEADECHAVERHLATCTECRRLVADLAATADLLPLALAAASSLRPPADLKDRVLRVTEIPPLASPTTVTDARPNVGTPAVESVNGFAKRWRAAPVPIAAWRMVA